jgi:alkylated DNA repair dioxygenase AlkB
LTPAAKFASLEHVFADEVASEGWQPSLLALGEVGVDAGYAGLYRIELDATSWLDHVPRWLSGSDGVFAELVDRLPWQQRRVVMYDRLIDEPRLTCWVGPDDPAPDLPVLQQARRALVERYRRPFDSIGFNLYRKGADSVAWHSDRVRHTCEDPVVAIVSVGSPRPFLIRPRGGGPSQSFLLGHGTLFVMGGACQHDWEHAVPKVAKAGPRLSITFRHGLPPPDEPIGIARNRHLEATRAAHPSASLGLTGGRSHYAPRMTRLQS